jgi:hypothetical protein
MYFLPSSVQYFYYAVIIKKMNKLYKIILLCTLFFVAVFNAFSQQNHFVYVQTENKQPFYIKLNKKLLSSSASGYLIIPKLQDGNYEFTIGFPKNEWPEQNVTCAINKKDAGYLLKNFGDKGWGLFNLQTMDVVMSGNAATGNKTIAADEEEKKKDAVTIAPSITVANDSAVVKKIEEKLISKEEAKPVIDSGKKEDVTIPPPVITDSVIIKKTEDKPEVKEPIQPVVDTVKKEEAKLPAAITKLLSASTAQGAEMIYVDKTNGKTDTVRVFIPAEKDTTIVQVQPQQKQQEPTMELQNEEVKKIEQPKAGEQKKEIKQEVPKTTDTRFIDITLPNPNAKPDTVAKQIKPEINGEKKPDTNAVSVPEKQKENISRTALPNSDCKALASEDDFLKLRKKMAAETSDDDMVNVARKTFKTKCFTTAQIKNLCVLFLNDEGRYRFFDAAYPFVSDSSNFGSLETLLTDNYFITRFKAMIRH